MPFGSLLCRLPRKLWNPPRKRLDFASLEKKDPDFEAKAQEVLLLYKRVEIDLRFIDTLEGASQPNGTVYISYDEKPGIQAIGNIHPDRKHPMHLVFSGNPQ